MKTHVLTFAKHFMKDHPREGEPTNFKTKIMKGDKIHTIRSNHEYWSTKMDEVMGGDARLALREWKGKPYRSKQNEFWEINKFNNPGYQLISINPYGDIIVDKKKVQTKSAIARNDGLAFKDFWNWFDIPFVGIIIHFTDFRY